MAGIFFPGNSQDRLPRTHRGSPRSFFGAKTPRNPLVMTEFLDSCRPTDDGGGSAHQADSLPSNDTAAEATCELANLPFKEVWAIDFEFCASPGENPEPVCVVAWELRSGRRMRLWRDEFGTAPPYPTGPGALLVAYYASAEVSCHLALGWPVPERVLDLFTEFRNRTNGIPTGNGAGL